MPKSNANTIDRIIRAVLGAALIYIGFFDQSIIGSQLVAYLLGAIGILNLITVVLAWCPVYALIGFSTVKKS